MSHRRFADGSVHPATHSSVGRPRNARPPDRASALTRRYLLPKRGRQRRPTGDAGWCKPSPRRRCWMPRRRLASAGGGRRAKGWLYRGQAASLKPAAVPAL
jgi:hypothetical protein